LTDHSLFKKKGKFTVEYAMKAQRESTGVTVLLFEHRHLVACVVNTTYRPLYPLERGNGSHHVGCGLGIIASLESRGNSHTPTGIRSPDRLALTSRYTVCALPTPHDIL
jgi:hypothetical protein